VPYLKLMPQLLQTPAAETTTASASATTAGATLQTKAMLPGVMLLLSVV
jgi:hypothetical protein